jgi:hypothetical protein
VRRGGGWGNGERRADGGLSDRSGWAEKTALTTRRVVLDYFARHFVRNRDGALFFDK